MKKALILGGGFAGCSLSHFLKLKGYQCTLLEKHKLGGLCRTYKYGGHPYEFGPHLFMWKNDKEDPITKAMIELNDGRLYNVERPMMSYVAKDSRFYKYPVHLEDIFRMPEWEQIGHEFDKLGRSEKTFKLKDFHKLPQRDRKTSFAKYYASRIGKTLYDKLMRCYTYKMWGYPGEEMPMDTTFVDQLRDKNVEKEVDKHDPIHFEPYTSGKGGFCVYPMDGFNPMFDRMTEDVDVRHEEVLQGNDRVIVSNGDEVYHAGHYDVVFNTLAPDMLVERKKILPAMGRMMIPIMLHNFWVHDDFTHDVETIYTPGLEFQTRLTNMDRITCCKEEGHLMTVEIPVGMGAEAVLPEPMRLHAEKNNLFCDRAYPDRRSPERKKLDNLRKKFPSNTIHCGRMAEWVYVGMSEVMKSAYDKVESL
jgi:UDP-galactopyranose mutase